MELDGKESLECCTTVFKFSHGLDGSESGNDLIQPVFGEIILESMRRMVSFI